jgi:hypothetical protein
MSRLKSVQLDSIVKHCRLCPSTYGHVRAILACMKASALKIREYARYLSNLRDIVGSLS